MPLIEKPTDEEAPKRKAYKRTLSSAKLAMLIPLAHRINTAMKLGHPNLIIPTNSPKQLKKDINDFKWQRMKSEWPDRFKMYVDEEHKRLRITFNEVAEAQFFFSGLDIEGELSIPEMITKAIMYKSKQTRFFRHHLDDHELIPLKSVEGFFTEISEDHITFTPRFDQIKLIEKERSDEELWTGQRDGGGERAAGTGERETDKNEENLFGFDE